MNASKQEKLFDLIYELECIADEDNEEIDKAIAAHIDCFNDAIESLFEDAKSEQQVHSETLYCLRQIIRDSTRALHDIE